ncbi:Fungal trans [Geosmithia morbida]|uniref:Fungal trans n=1 Tax=Geosmithia morbida TaxID=1094350 RepID=A0A9P4YQJ3_9HYPO|nr:Fungal trans [Geosmithia morbida]KAF4121283.1 Fungal trans [Geosmithia morbida]
MTTRISKACHECRARKIRCDGLQPCAHCTARGSTCVYRAKARNRMRRNVTPVQDSMKEPRSHVSSSGVVAHINNNRGSTDDDVGPAQQPDDDDDDGGGPDINIPSVAAIHGASPSMLVQVYYGPSSIFSLMNSIYHQIEGTCSASLSRQSLEEVGPGLDLFSHRRLFFGDLASATSSPQGNRDNSAIFLDKDAAQKFLQRYLDTYWQFFPSISKATFRQRLNAMFKPLTLFSFDTPDNIIVALALALGAELMGEEGACTYLLQRAKQGIEKLDEMVNVQMVQVYFMLGQIHTERARPNSGFLHIGSAVRRAIAAGLHKETLSRRQDTREDSEQKIVTVWALYFWETWTGFSLGRPSSLRDPGDINSIPKEYELLRVMARLSRIISMCVQGIYAPRHSSLLPVWTSANEIRQELLQFAEKEPRKVGVKMTGSVQPGHLGFSQALLSSFYHHTLQLTFRPFLILRAKMRKQGGPGRPVYTPPVWLDKACDYCLEAAKDLMSFLVGACRDNVLCRELKYFNLFVEGACYTFALDLLQETDGSHRSLPWIRSSIKCLQLLLPGKSLSSESLQTPITIAALVRMVRTVIPEFSVDSATTELDEKIISFNKQRQPDYDPASVRPFGGNDAASTPLTDRSYPPFPYVGGGGGDVGDTTSANSTNANTNNDHHYQPQTGDAQMDDFAAMNMGLDFDFGVTDMDAFLSIDPNQNWVFRP